MALLRAQTIMTLDLLANLNLGSITKLSFQVSKSELTCTFLEDIKEFKV